jgi:hypothetical protein
METLLTCLRSFLLAVGAQVVRYLTLKYPYEHKVARQYSGHDAIEKHEA